MVLFRYKISYIKFLIFLFFISSLFLSCNQSNRKEKNKNQSELTEKNDLERIINSKTLRVVVDYNSTNYFVYRGKPMGFKYDLLQDLCNELDVKLELIVSNDLGDTFEGLKDGRYDLIAKSLTVTKQRNKQIDFTVPLMQTNQVLVQRVRSEVTNEDEYIKSALEMAGKKIHVQKNTSYYRRLVNLSEEIGAPIEIIEDTIYGVEQLIQRVAEGDIDYTVCDANVARLNKTYYPNLDVSLKISFAQNIAWGVRKDSKEWKEYLDEWITRIRETRKYKQLYHKYFQSPRVASRLESDFHSITGGKISRFDKIIQEESREYNWDWRLISAIAYQESRFNPTADSWAGAYGLMQLMPSTAKSLGVEDYKNPKQNVKAGILFLNWLNDQFQEAIPDSTERVKFVLASYNVGMGHVKDAQRLAKKYGKNEDVWEDNVDYYLRNKSAEKYYKDPVVRWGYCRGEEAYNYVKKVLVNYTHYQNVIPEKILAVK